MTETKLENLRIASDAAYANYHQRRTESLEGRIDAHAYNRACDKFRAAFDAYYDAAIKDERTARALLAEVEGGAA